MFKVNVMVKNMVKLIKKVQLTHCAIIFNMELIKETAL